MDNNNPGYTAIYKQKPVVIQTGTKECPNNTWQIGGNIEKEDIVCSIIDTNFCESINSNVEVSWAQLEPNKNGMVSKNGIIKCEWPSGTLTGDDVTKL